MTMAQSQPQLTQEPQVRLKAAVAFPQAAHKICNVLEADGKAFRYRTPVSRLVTT